MNENAKEGVDVIGCVLLVLVISALTLGAIGTAIQVTPWLLLLWVPFDLVFVLLLVATVAVGMRREDR